MHMTNRSPNQIAISATLHCLTGCAIGEISGMIIGTALGLTSLATIALAVTLAFFFGYLLTIVPLVRAGMSLAVAVPVALASDTFSIATMEIVDNAIMAAIPGAMGAGIVNPIFWASLAVALFIAFWAAVPVNRYLIQRGQGHALVHKHHEHH